MWLLGFELWTFRRAARCSYPLSHLTTPSKSTPNKKTKTKKKPKTCWCHSLTSLGFTQGTLKKRKEKKRKEKKRKEKKRKEKKRKEKKGKEKKRKRNKQNKTNKKKISFPFPSIESTYPLTPTQTSQTHPLLVLYNHICKYFFLF
jgi:phenylalanyl-tRNA synthetase alpha subunit